ncbi:MAG: biosynthetic peptidoglycan transglycosylase [Pseudomonadota bacterium]
MAYRATASELKNSLLELIAWQNVEERERYQPRHGQTFCNLYVLDHCWLCGCPIPIEHFHGQCSANRFQSWLNDEGQKLGWKSVPSIEAANAAAERNQCTVSVARSSREPGHGHTTLILGGAGDAECCTHGFSASLLQSQAGVNPTHISQNDFWWIENEGYGNVQFWTCEKPSNSLIAESLEERTKQAAAVIACLGDQPYPACIDTMLLRDAVLALEDRRFYRHPGFDIRAIFRAIWTRFMRGELQGASTIDQQLFRTITDQKEKSITRKFREIVASRRIDQLFDKRTILDVYLQIAYYGTNMKGIDAAKRRIEGENDSDFQDELILAACLRYPLPKQPSRLHWKRIMSRAEYAKEILAL